MQVDRESGEHFRAQNETLIDRPNPWRNLVIAMLSVSQYPLSKALALSNELSANGLCCASNYASWSEAEIARRLVDSGYDRGSFMTYLLVERLASIAALLDDLGASERVLAIGTRLEVAALLSRVKGVGPMVLDNFFRLRGTVARSA